MTTIHSHNFLRCALVFTFYILINCQDVAKLPYCNEKVKQTEYVIKSIAFHNGCNMYVYRLIFVSTLDGLFTALTPTGDVSWKIETGPGPLLISNIHKLEVSIFYNNLIINNHLQDLSV